MKTVYFVGKRFIQAFAGMFALLALVYMSRGQQMAQATQEAATWAGISAIVFALTVLYYRKNDRQCAVCRDGTDAVHD